MRGFAFRGDRQIALLTKPTPVCGPREVLVRVRATAVCGSDLHYYRQSAQERRAAADFYCGHEPVGVVAAVGADVRTVSLGDRVVVYHVGGCGHCSACDGGRFKDCPQAQQHVMQRSRDGANAEFVVVHERQALPLPDSVSFEAGAVLACSFGTAWAAVKQTSAPPSSLAVWGLGPVGLNTVVIANLMGLRTVGIDLSGERREAAAELGCEVVDGSEPELTDILLDRTDGAGFNTVIETTGATAVHHQAATVTHRGGTIVLVGLGANSSIGPTREIILRELCVRGSWIFGVRDWPDILDFVLRNDIDLMRTVDRVTSIEHFRDAMSDADQGSMAKIVFSWPPNGLPDSLSHDPMTSRTTEPPNINLRSS
ncbi:alcohol dehydrogenase catalytic domain-containing protein [Mycobacterium deserti]|uniref:Alcohol dehydrogenase catalytic domain-containing protein n=1 Tax=Mycobacterium deserti TaxID=2978347 RepID=A0ABT2MGR0_9MYCO|nr:alcohol dehydrogenase catalytic domain-containing protein [Mycobacterium deserti]MCT7660714.1 alcohol dehydrogenase catalytic domain-containing protein [Mycobacterium deserti]